MAAIVLHPNGKSLYVSSRGDNTISSFAIAADGSLDFLENTPAGCGHAARHGARFHRQVARGRGPERQPTGHLRHRSRKRPGHPDRPRRTCLRPGLLHVSAGRQRALKIPCARPRFPALNPDDGARPVGGLCVGWADRRSFERTRHGKTSLPHSGLRHVHSTCLPPHDVSGRRCSGASKTFRRTFTEAIRHSHPRSPEVCGNFPFPTAIFTNRTGRFPRFWSSGTGGWR